MMILTHHAHRRHPPPLSARRLLALVAIGLAGSAVAMELVLRLYPLN